MRADVTPLSVTHTQAAMRPSGGFAANTQLRGRKRDVSLYRIKRLQT